MGSGGGIPDNLVVHFIANMSRVLCLVFVLNLFWFGVGMRGCCGRRNYLDMSFMHFNLCN